MTIQTCGSHSWEDDEYSFTICKEELAISFEGLKQSEIEDLIDLFHCLLFPPEEPYTFHSNFEPNDVF